MSDLESTQAPIRKVSTSSVGKVSVHDDTSVLIGRENLSAVVPPDVNYEGRHRWDPNASWTREEERKVVRKTDLRLLPWLCVMFFGLQLDRGNLSNALADNLLVDLKLTSDDYNNGTTIQLLSFLAAEFPVQFLTKRYGFRRVLPTLMFMWGTVSWAQAWMTDRTGFYITRALIGACEGGFIPGAILYATYFYNSREISTRLAVFWSTLNVARVISALLAAGILEMRGVSGRPGWFWLFLLEGVLTVVLALISFIYLPASPTNTTNLLFPKPWYTEREEVIMVNRILRDDPAKGLTLLNEPANWKDVKETWSDPSLWGLFMIGLVAYIPATPVQSYLTLTLKRLGFSTFNSNMLTIPSAALQILTMLTLAWSSEKWQEKTFHCFVGEAWLLPLLVALITLPDGGREWSRFALVTLVSGYPYFHPIVSSWISENSFSVKKRAIAAATYNVIVQVGSLIGSQIYRKYDAPYYKQGNTVLVSICALSLVVFVVQRQWLVRLAVGGSVPPPPFPFCSRPQKTIHTHRYTPFSRFLPPPLTNPSCHLLALFLLSTLCHGIQVNERKKYPSWAEFGQGERGGERGGDPMPCRPSSCLRRRPLGTRSGRVKEGWKRGVENRGWAMVKVGGLKRLGSRSCHDEGS